MAFKTKTKNKTDQEHDRQTDFKSNSHRRARSVTPFCRQCVQ